MDVDEDEEEGDQHRHPSGDHLGVDEEADPGDDDKQSRREVVGDYVEAHLAGEDDLEAGGAVVHPDGHVVGVLRPEGLEVDPVVEDGLDDGVLWHHCILKLDLAHWIVEAAHTKFTNLEFKQNCSGRKFGWIDDVPERARFSGKELFIWWKNGCRDIYHAHAERKLPWRKRCSGRGGIQNFTHILI